MTARFAIGASTHPGMIRSQNEDSYTAASGLFVVADGMGGHQAGEVASELAIRTLREAHQRGFSTADDLAAAVQTANDAIRRQAAGTPDHAGMGTTLTGLAVLDETTDDETERHGQGSPRTMLAVANVGDSRTYLWRHRQLLRITVDHSYVQELVSSGQITQQEARLHPRRNIVTRALGIDPSLRVDTWVLPAVTGDRFIVCSDGLVDEVPDHEIAALIDGIADPQQTAEQLVAMANRHGGRDNITVVIVDVLEGMEAPDDGLPEPVWAEGLPEAGDWADPDHTDVFASPADAVAATTATLPITGAAAGTGGKPGRSRRDFGLPQLLFLFALGAIVMVVIVVVLLAVKSDPEAPTPTTVVPTSTTVAPTSTTTPRTTTTVRPTTTSAPPTTAPPTTAPQP